MHARYPIVVALLGLVGPVLAASCVAPMDSSSDEGAGGANMTPNDEPVGEAAQEIAVCECSIQSDFCSWTVGGKCVVGFNACSKTVKYGCGFAGAYPCVGWCVRR
jgi:hypothetical protein